MYKPEDVFGKEYQEFIETDPFNNNEVKGFICRNATEYYGALIITHVNGKETKPQLIMGTPKMHYPFTTRADSTRKYTFPSAKSIEIYEKLDGTNILSFFYSDGQSRYLSFKTRLKPFLGSGRFGNFEDMWREVAKDYFDEIRRCMNKVGCNLSFELYGSRNTHLIVYPFPLKFSLLFGVAETGRIIPPSKIEAEFDKLPILKTIDKDYVWNYEQLQQELDSKLQRTDDGYYIGSEGTVWYLQDVNGGWLQIKNKPGTIEDIHFSQSMGISRNVIVATCWNALENTDNPTVEFVSELLEEEFSKDKVASRYYAIQDGLNFVLKEAEFRQRVLELYKATGRNIILEKAEVMRELSPHFAKKDMRKVHGIISSYA